MEKNKNEQSSFLGGAYNGCDWNSRIIRLIKKYESKKHEFRQFFRQGGNP